MRSGTLAIIVIMLVALIVFGFFLFRQVERRSPPDLPTPTASLQ